MYNHPAHERRKPLFSWNCGATVTRPALTRKTKVRALPVLHTAAQGRFFNAQKGGQSMTCEHKRIKSENCVISCVDCGEILPLDFLTGKKSSAPETPAETPEKAVKTKPTRKKVAK